jgi:chemotaxis protein MotB
MRGKSPEKDRSERYLLTYADLMNLLLILFIVLFCASSQDNTTAIRVLNAIAKGFGTVSVAETSKASDTSTSSSSSMSFNDFYNQLVTLLKNNGDYDKVTVTNDSNEVIVSLKDNVLFAPGKADLGVSSTNLLNSMGNLITKISCGQILIEGHTDSDPLVNTSQYQDNLALSSARADNVERVFLASGIAPKKLVALGYGEFWPIAPNDNAVDKAKNRRVVITILKKSVTPPDQSVAADQLIKTMQDAAAGQTESQASAVRASSNTATSSKS